MQKYPLLLLSLQNHKHGFMKNTLPRLCSFILLGILFSTVSVSAQIHFKVGYTPSYFEPEVNNNLLQAFNDRNPWLDDKFGDLNWSHGLDVGLRYRIGFVGIEASWRASFANVNAEGRLPTTNASFQKKFLYRYNTYSLGLENYIGRFGLGASVGYNRLSMRERTADDRLDVLKTEQWIGTLFAGIYTEHNGSISFGLRPFVQLPLSRFDLTKLASNLGEPSAGDVMEKEYLVFGISLIIFNGY